MTGKMLLACIVIFVGVFVALVMIDPAAQFQHNSRITYAPAGSKR